MLRSQRLSRLLVALSACALFSSYASLILFRILEKVALPRIQTNMARDIAAIQDLDQLKRIATILVEAAFELRDSGWFFATWGIGFVAVWSIVLGVVALLLSRSLTECRPAGELPAVGNAFDRALSGTLELRKAFWGGFVGIPLLVGIGVGALVYGFNASRKLEHLQTVSLIAIPIASSLYMVSVLTAALAVWRCAGNSSRPAWGTLARITVVVAVIALLAKSVVLPGLMVLG